MSEKKGNSKKPRKHKIALGQRRSSRRVRLTAVQLVLLGKGAAARVTGPMSREKTDRWIARRG